MKNLKLDWSALLFNLVVMLFIIGATAPGAGEASLMIGGFYMLLVAIYSFLPVQLYPNGTLRNEVVKKLFATTVQEKLFPPNQFFAGAQEDTGIALDAEEIEVPQDEDGESEVVEDPKVFPLEVVDEEDKKKTYKSSLVATKPQRIGDLNQAITSYDKRAAKSRKHVNTLNNRCAEIILHGWAPDGIVNTDFTRKTTGGTVRPGKANGATGNRKKAVKEDIMWMFTVLNDYEVPNDGLRRLVIPPHLYEDIFYIDDFIHADKLKARGDLAAGQIGELMDFRIFLRNSKLVYTNDANPVRKARGAAADTTDNQAAVAFHPHFVRYAKGNVMPYLNKGRGDYLGDMMNFALRTGATKSRLSEIGAVTLVEDNA